MPGSFDRMPSGRWRGRVTIAGKQYTFTGDRKKDVTDAVSTAISDAAKRGDTQTRGRQRQVSPTMAQHLNDWHAEHAADWSPSYSDDVRRVIDQHLIPGIGTIQIGRLHQTDLNAFYRSLEVGPARIRRIHNVVAAALEQAVQDDLIASNPARKARPPVVPTSDINPPSPEDVVRIISVADTIRPGLAMFVHLAAVTGARRGELVALRWSDIQDGTLTISKAIARARGRNEGFGEGYVLKGTKTHAVRRLRLDPAVLDALEAHHADQQDWATGLGGVCDDPFIFARTARLAETDQPFGSVPWSLENTSRAFLAAVQKAGLDGIRLHDLRHAAATQMMAAGIDVVTGASRLGHKRRDTFLNRYAHAVAAADQNAADTLGNLYRRQA